MAKKVNLDALIPIEDFEIQEDRDLGRKKETISIEDLKADSFFFPTLGSQIFKEKQMSGRVKKYVSLLQALLKEI